MSASPKVTVLMPVFNAEKHLREAVDSILCQTFTDFELLIINDGSTDRSESIIRSYADPRIRLVNNASNMRLVATLNKGIGLASGEYVARMDADDISHPSRFAKQVAFLDQNPSCAMVAAKVRQMDCSSNDTGVWPDDCNAVSGARILKQLPFANCIAHPTVMIRKEVINRYGYDPDQRHSEDYDLWLRMAADGCVISKLDDFLLRYRIHDESVTVLSNTRGAEIKNIHTKRIFALKRVQRLQINAFVVKVVAGLLLDIVLIPLKRTKTFLYTLAVKSGLKPRNRHHV